MDIPTTPYFLILLTRGPQYNRLEQCTDGHIAYVDDLISDKKLYIGGDILFPESFNRKNEVIDSAYLLDVRTQKEAVELSSKDPFIENGIYVPIIIQWNLIGMEASE